MKGLNEPKCSDCDLTFPDQIELMRHFNKEHPTRTGDKILGINAWNIQPRDTGQRIMGHKPSLDDYDRRLR